MISGHMDPKKLLHSKERFFILLCLIVGLLVLDPIVKRFGGTGIVTDIFLTAIAISMVYTVSHKRWLVVIGILLAIAMLAFLWSQYLYPNKNTAAMGMIAGVLFTAGVIIHLLAFTLKSEEVNREIIYAAILLYLLGALLWAFLYAFLALMDPASFNVDISDPRDYLSVFQYYSVVTITTLGYGDITPATAVAKAFSALEALVGQLYMVVAVAWLVGMHVSRKAR